MKARTYLNILAAAALPLALAACETPAPGGAEATSAAAPASASASASAPAASGATVAMPAGLTSDERLIWNSLTPDAKRRAVEYMAAGGTFRQFVTL